MVESTRSSLQMIIDNLTEGTFKHEHDAVVYTRQQPKHQVP